MSENSINDVICALAERVVLAVPEDLQALADLHEKLEQVASQPADALDAPLRSAARQAARQVESIILRTADDPSATLDTVSKTIAALQAVIVEGQDLSGVVFPDGETDPSSGGGSTDNGDAPSAAPGHTATASDNNPTATDNVQADAAAAPSEPTTERAADQPTPLSADPDLLGGFVAESKDHLDEVDVQLLALESDPEQPEALNAVFRAFHTIKGVAGFLELTDIHKLAHEVETLLDQGRRGELVLTGPPLDVVFDATDVMKRMVDGVADALNHGTAPPVETNLAELINRVRSAASDSPAQSPVDPVIQAPTQPTPQGAATQDGAVQDSDAASPGAAGHAPQDAQTATTPPVATAPTTAPNRPSSTDGAANRPREDRPPRAPSDRKPPAQRTAHAVKETVKVDADRLDKLVETIGELVIAETMVSQSSRSDEVETVRVHKMLNQLDKITRELQELAMTLRMVPVRSTFQRMARLARDVAKRVDKRIEFVMTGEDTELDKTVVDAIADPLVHMVRNAVDHGLEPTLDDRRQAGKPDAGRVELRAFHKGGCIHIEIEDDGRGLDREVLLEKARSRGIVTDGDAMTDNEVFALIFEPGFSTAKTITDVSGRGVGLDVVKRNIEALRGKVEIRSELGRGSVFSIRLPLTLAIIEGMVVRVGDQRYIIPTLSIVRMIRPEQHDLSSVFGKGEMLRVGDRMTPLLRLDRMFGIDRKDDRDSSSSVVVVEDDGRLYSFVIDELLGQQQIVIKPLGKAFSGVPGLSGGAIMADGRVGLILDVAGLVRSADTEPVAASPQAA